MSATPRTMRRMFPMRQISLGAMTAASLLFASWAGAYGAAPTQPRNDSGQLSCYDQGGEVIECDSQEYPGQDAAYGRDLAAAQGALPLVGGSEAGFDFTKIALDGSELTTSAVYGGTDPRDWGCTRDNHTGLLWEIKVENDSSPRFKGWSMGWYNPDPDNDGGDPGLEMGVQLMCGFTIECNTAAYINHVNAQNLCGRSDWRLPTVDEMHGLIHYGSKTEFYALDKSYFPITDGNPIVWTSDTALEPGTEQALSVNLLDGHVEPAPKAGGAVVPMLVSGAQYVASGPDPLCGERENLQIRASTAGVFVIQPDATVLDTRTGLVWDRCTLGQQADGEGEEFWCHGDGEPMPWSMALQMVKQRNEKNYLGYNDWRLPNIKELYSITERRCAMPVFDQRVFPNLNPEMIWSSTSDIFMDQFQRAWALGAEMGHFMPHDKGAPARIKLVRGGGPFADFQGAETFGIGGTLNGMVGTGLVLRLQSGIASDELLTLNQSGTFRFNRGLIDAAAYTVTLEQPPVPFQSCTVSNGSGAVPGGDVTDIVVDCDAPDPAVADVQPATFDFILPPGAQSNQSGSIRNTGGGILHWSIESAYSRGRPLVASLATGGECETAAGLIINDDGSSETGYGGGAFNNGFTGVDRFTPGAYPASIGAVCFAFGGSNGATQMNFDLVVYDDNGPGGAPGTELASIPAVAVAIPPYPVETPHWQRFDLSELYTTVDSGSVYVGIRGKPGSSNVFMLTDLSGDRPIGHARGWWLRNGTWFRSETQGGLEQYRAHFIRAQQAAAQPQPTGCVDPNTVPWLSVNPLEGQTNAGESTPFTVSVNSTGLQRGDYSALLCVANDGSNGLVEVPVSLRVEGGITITPIASAGGRLTPDAAQSVPSGTTLTFVAQANPGHEIESLGATCPGNRVGDSFVTTALTADCQVEAVFRARATAIFADGFEPD